MYEIYGIVYKFMYSGMKKSTPDRCPRAAGYHYEPVVSRINISNAAPKLLDVRCKVSKTKLGGKPIPTND